MKFIIFDIDGTLANTKTVEDNCFIAAFDETFGIDLSDQDWADLPNVTDWGITEAIIKRAWGRLPSEQEYDSMKSNFTQRLNNERRRDRSQFAAIEGATEFFNALRETDGMAVGIATGAWEESALIKLDAIGIDPAGVGFSNSNYFKTRASIVKDVIAQLKTQTGNEPERVVYFGDGVWDHRTCQEIGIDFIGIDATGDGKLKELGVESIFRNYRDQSALLAKI